MTNQQLLSWYGGSPDIAQLQKDIAELKKESNARKKYVSWANGKTSSIFITENQDLTEPHYDILAIDGKSLVKRNNLLRLAAKGEATSADLDKANVGVMNSELQEQAFNFAKFIDDKRQGKVEVAGTLLPNQYATIANVMANANVITWRNNEFVLDQAWAVQREDKIKVTLDDLIPYYADADIGLINIPEAKQHDYTRLTFFLRKGGTRIEWTKWLNMGIWDHDIKADASKMLTEDFPRLRNNDMAAGMTAFSSSGASGAYNALTAANYHYDFDPRIDFVTHRTTIRNNGGIPDTFVMNDLTFVKAFGNSFLRVGGELGEPAPVEVGPRVVTHPMIRNARIVIEPSVPNNIIYLGDARAFVYVIGPSSTRDYDYNDKYIAGSIAEIWYGSAIRNASMLKQITGATT